MSIGKQLNTTMVLIPSFEPDNRLFSYVKDLRTYGFLTIVVVNDGSGSQYDDIFTSLKKLDCTVLTHEVNLGKGTALKTGFAYIEEQLQGCTSVVTADSDGQHAAKDVYRLAKEAEQDSEALYLGVRNFDEGDTPAKSLFGNRVTSRIFSLLYGQKLADTQTGLRAFSCKLLPFMRDIRGSRFEYELQMLISSLQADIPIKTLPIQVIYNEGNQGTHFKAIRDSVRVMSVLLSNFLLFIVTSVISAVVDIGIAWYLIDYLRPLLQEQDYLRIFVATGVARILSIIVNYVLNKNFVFQKETSRGSLKRYLVLCGVVIILSSTGVYLTHSIFMISEKIAKLISDALLFLFSFQIQRRWVFAMRRSKR